MVSDNKDGSARHTREEATCRDSHECTRLRGELTKALAELERLRAVLARRILHERDIAENKLAAERERCARLADKYSLEPAFCRNCGRIAANIAAAIRKGEP